MGSENIWNWQDFDSWREEVRSMLSDLLSPPVIDEFLRARPEDIVSDDLGWLDEIVERITGQDVAMDEVLAQRIRQRYFSMRAFHGARVVDLESYREKGIIPLNSDAFEDHAKRIFLTAEFPEITSEMLENAIRAVGKEYRQGLLYFEADEHFLTRFCGHYMAYGSEYVCAIAANIPGGRDYRQVLKRFGSPMIFTCDIPLSLIDDALLNEFCAAALESIFKAILVPEYSHPPLGRGAGLFIRSPLPPTAITEYRVLEKVRDPLAPY